MAFEEKKSQLPDVFLSVHKANIIIMNTIKYSQLYFKLGEPKGYKWV